MNDKQQKNSSMLRVAGYVLLWLFFVYLYTQILGFHQASNTNLLLTSMYLILFGVHEVSHLLFMFLPDIMTAAAGSLSEVGFTGLVVFAAVRAKSYSAIVFGLLWMMLAFMSIGNYMADARAQAMPLAGIGSDPVHDWHFVFGQLGWLSADTAIGGAMKAVGWVVGAAGLVLGLMPLIRKGT